MARRWLPAGCGLIVALTFWLYGPALHEGLALDDHWHAYYLASADWSLASLLNATTLDTRDFVSLWWQDQPVRWEYPRPAAVALQKLVFDLSGGEPLAQHAVSLGLHLIACLLVWRLAWRVTRRHGPALLAGIIMTIYPHVGFAVSWIAAQNVVLQTVLLVGAVLAYARASGLSLCAMPLTNEARCHDAARASLRPEWVAIAAVLWMIALLTRESAVVLPVWLALAELSAGGWTRVRARWPVFLASGAVMLSYGAWRLLGGFHALPAVYLRTPGDDPLGYGAWALAKLLHYLFAATGFAPMMIGPTGRIQPWRETPVETTALLLILVAIALGYFRLTRIRRGAWLWPAWVLLAVLPVVPVMATPHTAYLCAPAIAVGLALVATTVGNVQTTGLRRLGRAALAGAALSMLLLAIVYRWQWTGLVAAERMLPTEIAAAPPGPDVRDVYLLNAPFVSIYAKQQLCEQLGPVAERLRVHVLTFAPDPVLIDQPCRLVKADDHTLIASVEGQPYFSRLLGRFLIDAFRRDDRIEVGRSYVGDGFTAQVLDANIDGATRIAFRFDRRLDDSRLAIYFGSAVCPAAPLNLTATSLENAIDSPVIRPADRDVLNYLATALGATPTDGALHDWAARLDPRLIAHLLTRRDALDTLIKQREEVPHARMWTRLVIRADLYLTGKPFDDPRCWCEQREEPAQ